MRRTALLCLLFPLLTACTSVSVQPVARESRLQQVCIQRNPKVEVSDFLMVLQAGFSRHNIKTRLFDGAKPDDCEYVLNYTARRTWDIVPYLSQAELTLTRNMEQVGYAQYHLRGRGGFSLMKWQGTASKIDPVIDRLLANQW